MGRLGKWLILWKCAFPKPAREDDSVGELFVGQDAILSHKEFANRIDDAGAPFPQHFFLSPARRLVLPRMLLEPGHQVKLLRQLM
jgi:hypothetical protein